jgi:hypothetical protein
MDAASACGFLVNLVNLVKSTKLRQVTKVSSISSIGIPMALHLRYGDSQFGRRWCRHTQRLNGLNGLARLDGLNGPDRLDRLIMTDLELAISNLRSAAQRYDKPDRYYRGDHDLAFATEKFENAFGDLFREFALNLCPSICDAVRDKLKINGFSVASAGSRPPATLGEDTIENSDILNSQLSILNSISEIDAIWSDNQMDLVAEEIHLEALKLGDSYAIVWPDEDGRVTIYPQRAAFCTVVYVRRASRLRPLRRQILASFRRLSPPQSLLSRPHRKIHCEIPVLSFSA